MKKIFLSLLFIASLGFTGYAQDVPFIDVGLKAGANAANFTNLPDGAENDGLKLGFVGGAYARFKIPIIGLYVQPEVQFSQMGGNFTVENLLLEDTEVETRINNLDFNLLLGQRFGVGPLGIRVNVGPTYSRVLSAEQTINGGDEEDIQDELKENLWALGLGAGLDISKLSIDLRYQLGLTRLAEDDENDDTRNSAIQLTLGFKLF
ncbi:MAG: porin family protein [Bacteroidota bacterium]